MRVSPAIPAAAALIAAVLSSTALAVDEGDFNYDSTASLYRICTTEGAGEGAVQAQLACRAFLEATVQYHDAVSDRKKMKRLVCYPPSATVADARNVFVAWGAKNAGNAERMGELPVVGVIRALAAAYPCK